ncbi:MAG: ABC transporter substrate-binding protein [Azoarcus sp.]|jgi:phospholipid transport system substrate-binding protein|nr:ABC transporter substrate-binding protein [Azoarcus sp.]
MTRKLFARCLLMLAVFFTPVAGFAAGEALPPDELVRNVTDEVLTIVRNDKAIQAGDFQKTLALVDEKILPHFNFRRMTSLAVGPGWRSASPEQQERLIAQFRILLVRTYSNALIKFRDQTIALKPLRGDSGGKTVTVNTEVRQAGAQPIPIDYSLEQTDNGWKVFDVIVTGASLVTNYRGDFTQEVNAKGVDGLIASLEAKNKSLEAGQGGK